MEQHEVEKDDIICVSFGNIYNEYAIVKKVVESRSVIEIEYTTGTKNGQPDRLGYTKSYRKVA